MNPMIVYLSVTLTRSTVNPWIRRSQTFVLAGSVGGHGRPSSRSWRHCIGAVGGIIAVVVCWHTAWFILVLLKLHQSDSLQRLLSTRMRKLIVVVLVIGGDDWMNGSSHINFLHRSWSLTAIRNKGLLRQLLRGIFCKGGCVYSWICWSDCYLLRETEGKETGTGTGIIRTKSKESWPILDKPANEYTSLTSVFKLYHEQCW